MSYAELQVTSQFSFLRGASSAEELFVTAALLGIKAMAVTDRNSVAGIVRACCSENWFFDPMISHTRYCSTPDAGFPNLLCRGMISG